jgi:toxin ParE1/3/4
MKLRWLRSGSEALRRIKAYIACENPAAAQKVGRQVRQAVLRLAEFPESGRPGQVPGTRELIVPGTPYLVVYRLRENTVEILRVFHTTMNWPPQMRNNY